MKIAATIKGVGQVGVDQFEDWNHTYIFDSSDSIDKMLEVTGSTTLSSLNLSEVKEDKI